MCKLNLMIEGNADKQMGFYILMSKAVRVSGLTIEITDKSNDQTIFEQSSSKIKGKNTYFFRLGLNIYGQLPTVTGELPSPGTVVEPYFKLVNFT